MAHVLMLSHMLRTADFNLGYTLFGRILCGKLLSHTEHFYLTIITESPQLRKCSIIYAIAIICLEDSETERVKSL